MAKANKNTSKQSDDTASVEKRVDAMMDPRANDQIETPGNVIAPAAETTLPPLDIYAQPTGAPPLAAELSKDTQPHEEKPDEPTPLTSAPPAVEERTSETVEDSLPTEITIKPLDIDTPQSDDAIADIVAQEADAVLAAEDANIADDAESLQAVESDQSARHGHPIFWFIVFILAVLCIAVGIMLMNPNLSLPFSA